MNCNNIDNELHLMMKKNELASKFQRLRILPTPFKTALRVSCIHGIKWWILLQTKTNSLEKHGRDMQNPGRI